MQTSLYGYQYAAIKSLRNGFANGYSRQMVQAPTGSGKTKIAAALAESAIRKGNRVGFLVPRISLIDQTASSFHAEGLTDIGVVQGDHPAYNPYAQLQICSVDTLLRRYKNGDTYPNLQVVIIDEAHEQRQFIWRWMKDRPNTTFIGLSATPWTKGLGLPDRWNNLIIAETTQGLIDLGILSDFKVFAPSKPDLDGLKTIAGDYHRRELGKRVVAPKLIANIVSTYKTHGENRPAIGFAVDRIHAKTMQEEFIANGIPSGYIDAHTEMDEREDIRKQFHNGELQVVWSVGCLTTGIDWDVRCIILARPTKSESLFVQMIGRGLRTAEGKDHCLILDHSDTHERLGFVTDIHHPELSTNEKEEASERKAPTAKTCPECDFVRTSAVCPNCGHESIPVNMTKSTNGDLIEITRNEKGYTTQEVSHIWGQLKFYAQKKGYKNGWVNLSCQEMTGSVPSNQNTIPLSAPAAKVKGFITHKNIKRAKGANYRKSNG